MSFFNLGLGDQQKYVKFMQQKAHFRTIDFPCESATNRRVANLGQTETERLELARKLDCRAISLPFSANSGQELDMVILFSNKRDGLGALLKNLSALELITALRLLDDREEVLIKLKLQKYTFQHQFDVKKMMQKAGVEGLVSDSAEFDKMFPGIPVRVDQTCTGPGYLSTRKEQLQ